MAHDSEPAQPAEASQPQQEAATQGLEPPEHFNSIKGKPVLGVGFGNVLKDIKPRKSTVEDS